MHQVLGLGLVLNAWYDFHMTFKTLYLTQASSVKNSPRHWCDGVCWQRQYVPAHGNRIVYLPSQQCF